MFPSRKTVCAGRWIAKVFGWKIKKYNIYFSFLKKKKKLIDTQSEYKSETEAEHSYV